MTAEEQDKMCFSCEFCDKLSAGHGFNFLGCTYGEYLGKWVAEIDKCPKDSEVIESREVK